MKDKIILIQGAMDIEIEYFVSQLVDKECKNIAGYEFYEGTINHIKVVISKTLIGTINSTIATTIGIMTFHPDIVINQGIAGSHKLDLHVGDIVIGEQCCNINSYSMPSKNKGEGSNPFKWEPNKRAKDVLAANLQLVNIIEKSISSLSSSHICKGILGSGDVFNREIDRIFWINDMFNNCSEDMESIGTYSVCNKFNVPCIGIRIISNNELLLEAYDRNKAIDLQVLLVSILHDLAQDF